MQTHTVQLTAGKWFPPRRSLPTTPELPVAQALDNEGVHLVELPVGIPWYARSAEFMQTDIMNTLRWMRVIGDTIFAAGALGLGWFVVGLLTGHSSRNPKFKPPLELTEQWMGRFAGSCDEFGV
jgi:hypothetical protein